MNEKPRGGFVKDRNKKGAKVYTDDHAGYHGMIGLENINRSPCVGSSVLNTRARFGAEGLGE